MAIARMLAALFIGSVLWLGSLSPVMGVAQKAPHGKEAKGKEDSPGKTESDEKHKDEGIFAPAGGLLDLGIWTLVVFLILFFVLRQFAWKPMLEGLQRREENIRKAVEEAEEARAETKRVQTEFQAKMDKAFAEIPKMMEEARRDAEEYRDKERARVAEEIQADRDRLRREIETARDQALQELWTQAAQLATMISAKAIGRNITEDDHKRLVDEALDELQKGSQQGSDRMREFGEEWVRTGGGQV